jgi:hypothetical protein
MLIIFPGQGMRLKLPEKYYEITRGVPGIFAGITKEFWQLSLRNLCEACGYWHPEIQKFNSGIKT